MEGTTELNQAETLESPKESPNNLLSKEAPVIMTANQDSPPVLQSSSNADVSSMDRDWPEHFSFFNKTQEVLVEELTLTNYKNAPNIPAGNNSTSSSSSGEKICKNTPNLRQGLWGNFRRIAGGTLGNVSNKPQFNSVDGGNDVYPQLRSFQNSNLNNSRVQIQNSNHFPQIVARNTALKGKEAAQKGGNRDKGQQNIERPNLNLEMISNFKKGAKSEEKEHCLFGGGSFGNFDLNNNNNSDKFEGVNMREFLKQRVNRGTKMQIFRQIVELLDSSHSQGLSLRHLRPSYFTILPLSLVKYTGGFLPLEVSSSARLEGNSAKKRYLENNQNHHQKRVRFKHQKIGEQGIDNNMSSKFEGDLRENVKSGGEMCKFEERWYASPEEQQNGLSGCPFAANVYSLGILLFELFGYFETWELHAAAMSDLRHRILPPNFLMENPKEAGFCLWLIHPDPSSRPKARDILVSDLITQPDQKPGIEIPQVTFQETESESEVLLQFLTSLKDEKEKQAAKLTKDLNWLDTDISQLERIHSSKSVKNEGITDRSLVYEERLMKSMDHLENAYFSLRSKLELNDNNDTNNNNNTNNNTTNNNSNNNNNIQTRMDLDVLKLRENSTTHEDNSVMSPTTSPNKLSDFFGDLCKYAQYNKFVQKGVLRNSEMLSSTNVICSLSFDRDEEYFAAAGVSKKIKIFEFEGLLNPGVDVHYPAVEMVSRAKLSCVCWNGYIKNYLASTDYEGVVQLWDASTGQGFTQLTEHRKRAWSVDFSRVDPAMLASGSDDCTVKIWNINEKSSVDTIRNVANVCSVQFSPHSSRLLAFGSADYKTYLYDLRHTRLPWCTLSGHSKAVSFVRFLDEKTAVSASTDNSLKVWDLGKTSGSGLSGAEACRLTLGGHTNEKNFVGLSVHDGYITCGSETNEVYAYYKSFPMPITSYKFGSIDPITGQETNDENSQFVSSVCWRGRGNMVISTNSSGSIKVLQLL